MPRRLSLAAALLGGTTLLHLIGGEYDVHLPLLAGAASDEMALYVSVLWHFVSLFLAWSTVAVLWALRDPSQRPQAVAAGALCLGMGALFLGAGLWHVNEIWTAPQWALLLPIAALLLWPARSTAVEA